MSLRLQTPGCESPFQTKSPKWQRRLSQFLANKTLLPHLQSSLRIVQELRNNLFKINTPKSYNVGRGRVATGQIFYSFSAPRHHTQAQRGSLRQFSRWTAVPGSQGLLTLCGKGITARHPSPRTALLYSIHKQHWRFGKQIPRANYIFKIN